MKSKKKLEDLFKERDNYLMPDMNVLAEDAVEAPSQYVMPDREVKVQKALAQVHKEDLAREQGKTVQARIVKKPNGVVAMDSQTPIDVGGVHAEEVIPPAPPQAVAPAIRPSVAPENTSEIEAPRPVQKLKEEIRETKSETDYSLSNPWMRALVGATPLLVGMLTGNKLEGVQTSADYFNKTEGDLWKRQLDLDGKMRELASKKETEKGGRRFSPTVVALEDGTSVRATFDTHTGSYLDPQGNVIDNKFIRAGYAVNPEEHDRRLDLKSEVKRADADYLGTNTKVNPATGELGIVRNGAIMPIQGSATGEFNVKQEKDLNDLTKSVRSSDVYKTAIPILNDYATAMPMIEATTRRDDPNWIAGSGVVFRVARMLQGPGVLTDHDVNRLGGSQQVNSLLERIIGRFRDNEAITPQDAQDLREVLSIAHQSAERRVREYYDGVVSTASKRHNIPEEKVREQLHPDLGLHLTKKNDIRGKNAPKIYDFNGKEYTAQSRNEVGFEMDGKLYFTDDWKNVKAENPKAKLLKERQ